MAALPPSLPPLPPSLPLLPISLPLLPSLPLGAGGLLTVCKQDDDGFVCVSAAATGHFQNGWRDKETSDDRGGGGNRKEKE